MRCILPKNDLIDRFSLFVILNASTAIDAFGFWATTKILVQLLDDQVFLPTIDALGRKEGLDLQPTPWPIAKVTVHGPVQRITSRRRDLRSAGAVTALFLSRT